MNRCKWLIFCLDSCRLVIPILIIDCSDPVEATIFFIPFYTIQAKYLMETRLRQFDFSSDTKFQATGPGLPSRWTANSLRLTNNWSDKDGVANVGRPIRDRLCNAGKSRPTVSATIKFPYNGGNPRLWFSWTSGIGDIAYRRVILYKLRQAIEFINSTSYAWAWPPFNEKWYQNIDNTYLYR